MNESQQQRGDTMLAINPEDAVTSILLPFHKVNDMKRVNLTLDLGCMGERNVAVKYEYSEGCVDHVPYGNQSIPIDTKPSIHVHSAIVVERGASIDISDFITGDDVRKLHNAIIDENHL